MLEHVVEEAAALAQVALHDPPPARDHGEAHLQLDLTRARRPREGGAEVGVLRVEDREEGDVGIGARVPRSRGLLCPREELFAVPAAQGLGFAGRFQELDRELADGLEHCEARLVRGAADAPDEALIDERGEGVEDVQTVLSADGLRVLQRPAAREDGQPREQPALGFVEQAVAPLERRAQRALSVGQVLSAADEQVERLVEPAVHRLGSEQLRPRGGQLDRERKPVEALTDAGHRGSVVLVELEVGIDRARPGREEAHRVVRGERFEVGSRARECERRHRVLVLAREA